MRVTKKVGESAEAKARRERAETQAEERRRRGLRDDASSQTRDLLRQFGARLALSGAGGAAGPGGFANFISGGGSGGSVGGGFAGGFGGGVQR